MALLLRDFDELKLRYENLSVPIDRPLIIRLINPPIKIEFTVMSEEMKIDGDLENVKLNDEVLVKGYIKMDCH